MLLLPVRPAMAADDPKTVLATGYLFVGIALDNAGRPAEAVTMVTKAAADPGLHNRAIIDRAMAYMSMDKLVEAERDLDTVLQAGGDDARLRMNYAKLGLLKGDNEAAYKNAQQARLPDFGVYPVLFQYIAAAKLGRNDKPALTQVKAALASGAWPSPVAALFLGETTPDKVEAFVKAEGGSEPACEWPYYLGEYDLQRQDKAAAIAAFRRGVSDPLCRRYDEFLLAGGELALLAGAAVPAPIHVDPANDDILSVNGAQTRIDEHQYRTALAILVELADRGDVKASVLLARLVGFGPQDVRNPDWAVKYARNAADHGNAEGEQVMGWLYLSGIGLPRDLPASVQWFRKSADHGDAAAQLQLGYSYGAGQGVARDRAEAMRWVVRAAEQGWPKALLSIGMSFAEGTGLPKDPRQAFFWYSVALPRLFGQDAVTAEIGRDRQAQGLDYDETRPLQIIASSWIPTAGALDGVRGQIGKTSPKAMTLDTGTGFPVDAAGDILTAAHVVHACQRLSVALSNGVSTEAKLLAEDANTDLALLQPMKPVGHALPIRSGRTVEQGETVLAAGYPLSDILGYSLNTTVGTVTSTDGWKSNKRGWLFSAAVSPGNSGGPLLDDRGAVIGVVEGQLDNLGLASVADIVAENINFAVDDGTIRDFLKAHKIAYAEAKDGAALSPVTLSRQARDSVLIVKCDGDVQTRPH